MIPRSSRRRCRKRTCQQRAASSLLAERRRRHLRGLVCHVGRMSPLDLSRMHYVASLRGPRFASKQQVHLLHLGRDYPKGYDYFRSRLKAAFLKNRDVKDPEQLTMLLARGQYIIKELEALYMLKKYRTLKKRYYTDTP
ncbi:hypothetical protein HPB50_025521 [Hyalomma asiaticum]|uniref:Uncharacterized protein n=1 Tax=Hyalomma asiaticum TaxID=266040 RepID=A0ACB7SR43_HYAAI|nr:hypothetical protein HPB50_025521 [Hyalomma asiaticum]